jgi:hypothetical protein
MLTMQKSPVYILIAVGVGLFFFSQWQINKVDRKLTCIYNQINALPYFIVPELRADINAIQQQMEFLESSCDRNYIFSGVRN